MNKAQKEQYLREYSILKAQGKLQDDVVFHTVVHSATVGRCSLKLHHE